jgi:hypothetical protein
VCLFSGGNVERAKGQLHTFAADAFSSAGGEEDVHVYYATNHNLSAAGVPEARTIKLNAAIDAAGYEGLARKSLALLDLFAAEETTMYGFFLKADDDTYMQFAVLRQLLSKLDPDIPLYLVWLCCCVRARVRACVWCVYVHAGARVCSIFVLVAVV